MISVVLENQREGFAKKLHLTSILKMSLISISAKIGGWFSLAIGASIVSFLEIIYISLALVIKLIKRQFRKSARYLLKSVSQVIEFLLWDVKIS